MCVCVCVCVCVSALVSLFGTMPANFQSYFVFAVSVYAIDAHLVTLCMICRSVSDWPVGDSYSDAY
jgi:hypothetical protein